MKLARPQLISSVSRHQFGLFFGVVCLIWGGLWVGTVHAQTGKGNLKGFVSDSTSGERLTLANVVVVGENMGAATDANGLYFIGGVPAGRVTVRVTLIGYVSVERQVTIIAGKATSLNFQLAPTTLMMKGVEQTAERRTRYDTEISTQPISIAEINTVPAIVESDLFRTISTLPGIVATSDVSSNFYVRGGGGDQNLIIIDGMTIYNPFHALGIFSIFDADAIRETEILKGGFPAQWGNRLSSVINIHTKEGNKNRFSGKVNVSQVSGKVMLEGPGAWDGSWMVAGRKSFFDDVLQKFVQQETPFDFYDIIARANHATGENGRVSLHMLLSEDRIVPGSLQEPQYAWYNKAFGVSWFQMVENRYLLETTFSMSRFRGELIPRGNQEIPARLSEISDTYFSGAVTFFQDNGDNFGAGFMFRLPQYHYSFTNAASILRSVDGRNNETGMWLKYKVKQWDPVYMEVGVRSDLFSVLSSNGSDAFEPRFSLGWDMTDEYAVKFSYSRVHQRMITITNEDDIVSLFETWIPLKDDAPSQQADHFIMSVDGALPVISGLTFDVQGYYKDLKHLVEYNRDKIDENDPDFIQASGSSYGLEILLDRKDPVLSGWISYTLSFTEREVGSFTYPPRYDRRHNLNCIVAWRPGDDWEFSVRWEYGSGLPFTQIMGFYDRISFGGIFEGQGYGTEKGAPYTILGKKNQGRLPDYQRLDLSAAKSFRWDQVKLTLEASVLNATDRNNMFYFNRTTGQRIDMLPILPTATIKVEF